MEYKKIQNKNYNLHIIKTDKFKSINLRINFKRRIKKEELSLRNMVNDLLINSSKNYKTSREVEIATEDLYDLAVIASSYNSGNYHIISFKEKFLNEKYTEEGMNYKSIDFLFDLIFNPNVEDYKFDKQYFDIIKDNNEEYIKSLKDNTKRYSVIRLLEEMSKGPLSYRACGYLEDLDKITEKNLYDYYKDVIENDIIDIFIIGDIDDTYEEIFNKYIPNTIRIKDELEHGLSLEEIKFKEIKETMKMKQSKLAIGLTTKDLTEFELKYVLSLYSQILGGGPNSKLFQTVREKNSLCYYIGTNYSLISKIITISAGINKKDYNKTIKLIKDELENMKKGIISDDELEDCRKIYIAGCNEIYDSPDTIIANYLSHEYLNVDFIEDRINNIKKVTKEDIINVAKKIDIGTIFLLEGEDIDEEDTTL